MAIPNLNAADRRAVLDAVLRTVDTKFMGPDADTGALRATHEAAVVNADAGADFEVAVNAMLRDLGVSHTGFFHESTPRTAGRVALAATFTKATTPDGERWMFQDVHPGGAAAAAGIRPGDVLLSVAGRELTPPTAMPFTLGERYEVVLRRADGSTASPTLSVPHPKDKRQPVVVPDQVVTASRLDGGIGLLRVSMFPGVLGMDVARDMSRAVAELACDRLIVDLRGNTGGGIGGLRLMSLMCPDRRGVGYSIGRSAAKAGRTKEQLPAFDRIPSSKWGVIPLIVKFARAGRTVAVFTETLGTARHHGRVVLLVNEHSASAAEMVAAFASEYRLATLVGTKTPGRLVATSAFKVGHGYRVALPVAAYYTWKGTNLEGRGVVPDIEQPIETAALWQGQDTQLQRAMVVATGC
ncbi:MAG TPA: S41 family peptidase [Vicinamibacterales bacterium]|nr:S41 family peptidase [Vicinamibacterales bacterium]